MGWFLDFGSIGRTRRRQQARQGGVVVRLQLCTALPGQGDAAVEIARSPKTNPARAMCQTAGRADTGFFPVCSVCLESARLDSQ